MITFETTAIFCLGFLLGALAASATRNRMRARLIQKLDLATHSADALDTQLRQLRLEYFDLQRMHDARGNEIGQLRREVMRLKGGPRLVRNEVPR